MTTALVVGVCSIVALAAFGPRDAEVSEAIVIVASVVGAYILRPLAELGWNYLWVPWRALQETVAGLSKQSEITTGNANPERSDKQFKAIAGRLQALRGVESELRSIRKRLSEALRVGSATTLRLNHPYWDGMENLAFGGAPDLQGVFVELRDLMDELEAVKLGQVVALGPYSAEDRERIQEALLIVEKALAVLKAQIDRTLALR